MISGKTWVVFSMTPCWSSIWAFSVKYEISIALSNSSVENFRKFRINRRRCVWQMGRNKETSSSSSRVFPNSVIGFGWTRIHLVALPVQSSVFEEQTRNFSLSLLVLFLRRVNKEFLVTFLGHSSLPRRQTRSESVHDIPPLTIRLGCSWEFTSFNIRFVHHISCFRCSQFYRTKIMEGRLLLLGLRRTSQFWCLPPAEKKSQLYLVCYWDLGGIFNPQSFVLCSHCRGTLFGGNTLVGSPRESQ